MKNTFKSTKALFLAFLLLTFACSNDDDTTVVVNLQDLQVTIDENPTNGDVIGTIQSNSTGSLTYNITSQTPNSALQINGNTGELTVADASLFDFETNPTITATVSATGAENTAMVTINLNNVIETDAQDFTTSVDENPTNGDSLGTVQATGDGTLTFSISSQTPTGAIAIDASTGELTVADAAIFDFETNPVITATISIDNSGNIDTVMVTINVNNVNELSIQDFTATIDENPANGLSIGTIQAQGDGTLTYSINSQTPMGAIAIDAATGELTVIDPNLFDFETNPNMLATISVSNGIQTVSANAMVSLNDVNEIGEYKFGGVIFWIDPASNNSAGLVCDINDLNSGNSIVWNNGANVPGAEATIIGSGQANTSAIVAAQATGTYAASLCDNLSLGTYNDWSLPSQDEFYQIYLNKTIINTTSVANGGANLNTVFYWTSTQDSGNANLAYIVRMSNGNIEINNKLNLAWVRAVRAWTDF